MKRPNIVFICTDQQRFDSLGCTGNPVVCTPHLDSLASQGTRFERHNTPCPICSPSRATIFTGLYPRNHRLVVNGMALDTALPTLPGRLADAGYRTHGIGKHHLQPILAPAELNMPESTAFWQNPEAAHWKGPYYGLQSVNFVIGEADQAVNSGGHYARWLRGNHPGAVSLLAPEAALGSRPADLDEVWKSAIPADLHYNTWITQEATHFIKQADEPFFLFVSFPDPHHPFAPPRPYCDYFAPQEVLLPRVVPGELERMPSYYRDIFCPGAEGFLQSYWGSPDDVEQGFLLQTSGLNEESLRLAIAHTYGMIKMIDDAVGSIMETLRQCGLDDDTIILFTSDHGELLGDHGLLHKGPPPYRQLREIPLIIKGPGLPAGETVAALTSHADLMPTLLDLAGEDREQEKFDGISLRTLLSGTTDSVREILFAEYHPRSKAKQFYNQTVLTDCWRLTIYPLKPEWGELFDQTNDPYEHFNRYFEPGYEDIVQELKSVLAREFPPQLEVDAERIAKW
jgi:arylsulfatase A-like enzyme